MELVYKVMLSPQTWKTRTQSFMVALGLSHHFSAHGPLWRAAHEMGSLPGSEKNRL